MADWDAVNSVWVPVATPPSWFIVDASVMGDLYIEFKQPTQPASGDSQIYNIMMKLWDIYNVATPNVKVITMNVKRNFPPDAITPLQFSYTIPDTKVPYAFKQDYLYKYFKDAEGD